MSTAAVALYARVSTEDQAERQTVQAQLDFLRKYADLHALPVAGEYVDDGISGTVPLDQRPDGRRLLDEAHAGRFGAVIVYRLDRMGRSLKALIAAHDALERDGVAIRSGTEPFDTATPIGRFLFQLLGSMAELERNTITERMVGGRDRVARGGRYTGGPIPLGYDLDAAGCLVPSVRVVPETGQTEADLVRDLFQRVAEGSSVTAEARRLNALGVRPVKRYGGGKELTITDAFSAGRLSHTLRNPIYVGAGRLDSRNGAIIRPALALIDRATWDAVRAQLVRNKKLATRNATHLYLLRGLLRCENCGLGFSGRTWVDPKTGREWHHYRCNGQVSPVGHPCVAKLVAAEKLEATVWAGCRRFILNPKAELAGAQRELRERLAATVDLDERRRDLQGQIAGKEAERDRVISLFRRGRITSAEADRELDAIARETATLRALIESLRAQEAMAQASEAYLTEVAAGLARLRDELADIEATDDQARKREAIELLVRGISIRTEGERRRKRAVVTITYAYRPHAVETSSEVRT